MEKSTGEKIVRTDFNVNDLDRVSQIKREMDHFINCIETDKEMGHDARLCNIAITKAEEVAMWAVKAATSEAN